MICFTNDFIACAHGFGVELRADANQQQAMAFTKNSTGEYCMMFSIEPKLHTIAHEALHTVNSILFDRGVEVSTKNDEAQAYLLSWVVDQIDKARSLMSKKRKDNP